MTGGIAKIGANDRQNAVARGVYLRWSLANPADRAPQALRQRVSSSDQEESMHTTSRRNIIKSFVAGGVLAGTAPVAAKSQPHGQVHLPGGNAHATVVFGQWITPMDRFTGAFTPANIGHHVSPHNVTIAAGGSVAFLIGGFHLVLIYNDGVEHGDVNTALQVPGPPVPLINDPNNRLYRGLDPRANPVDRIEVVHFHQPGKYLMACGVLPHFHEMFGYIKVTGPAV
jgi:hypothetical protein